MAKPSRLRDFLSPKTYKVKLFRGAASTYRTNWVVTNDLTQDCLNATQEVCGMRWKLARQSRQTVYRIKHGLLDDYLGTCTK